MSETLMGKACVRFFLLSCKVVTGKANSVS